jgi:CCR4-NOT transcriptional regulation complex NOT5 subunit
MRKVKDKEGVVFEVVLDPKIKSKLRKKDSVLFVKKTIEEKLKSRNVYPENNKVGFHGEIEHLSYFIAGIIDSYLLENQYYII